jgi:hypothetical protein
MSQPTTLDLLAMWLGYGVMLVGGAAILALLAWWAFDVIATRLGWVRLFYRHSRTIIAAERRHVPGA